MGKGGHQASEDCEASFALRVAVVPVDVLFEAGARHGRSPAQWPISPQAEQFATFLRSSNDMPRRALP
eukprot:8126475-Pyramimonas_sp.AAC.1